MNDPPSSLPSSRRPAFSVFSALAPLRELTLARVREFVREPEALFWVFVFPVLLAFALGIAFRSRPPEKLRVAVVDSVPGAESVAERLNRSADLQAKVLAPAAAAAALRTAQIELVVEGGSSPASSGSSLPEFTFGFDPTQPQSRLARLAVEDALQRGLGRPEAAVIRERTMTEPGGRYIDFLIPGLIGMNLMGSGMWGVGFDVVRARNRKLLKRLAATPMRRSHFLLSFMISRLLGLIPEVALVVAFGWAAFGMRVEGSFLLLSWFALLGAFTFSGLGLLVAVRTESIEAVSGWMNFVMLPMWILSGIFFSYTRFPEFLHPFIRALPLTALNDALRGVINEGASFLALGPETAVLMAWGTVSFAVALRYFKWQ